MSIKGKKERREKKSTMWIESEEKKIEEIEGKGKNREG